MWAAMHVTDRLFAAGVEAALVRLAPDAKVLRGCPNEPESAVVDLLIIDSLTREATQASQAWKIKHPRKPLIMVVPTGGFDLIGPDVFTLGMTMPKDKLEWALSVVLARTTPRNRAD